MLTGCYFMVPAILCVADHTAPYPKPPHSRSNALAEDLLLQSRVVRARWQKPGCAGQYRLRGDSNSKFRRHNAAASAMLRAYSLSPSKVDLMHNQSPLDGWQHEIDKEYMFR